jgi:hypothetical protein
MNKQTHEEKVKMYNKLSKKELIELLISSNNALELKLAPVINPSPVYVIPECDHAWFTDYSVTACQTRCTKCGKIYGPNTLTTPFIQQNPYIYPQYQFNPTTTTSSFDALISAN